MAQQPPLNPFDSDDVENAHVVVVKNALNPFDDEVVEPPSVNTEQNAPPRPPNVQRMVKGYGMGDDRIAIQQAFEMLVNVGYLPEIVKASLHNSNDVVQSFESLYQRVKEMCLKDPFGCAPSLWKSPIAVRIGSWMPHKNPNGTSDFTYYYVTVCNVRTNQCYQVHKRYSEFHALYLNIYSHLVAAFTKGMQNLFPDNRVTTWFAKESDQLRNSRREYLDGWLREVCLNALVMLNLPARNKIYDFLEIDKNFSIVIYQR